MDHVTTGIENGFNGDGSILAIGYILSTNGRTTRKDPALKSLSWTFLGIPHATICIITSQL
jgi:hypothetical protein